MRVRLYCNDSEKADELVKDLENVGHNVSRTYMRQSRPIAFYRRDSVSGYEEIRFNLVPKEPKKAEAKK